MFKEGIIVCENSLRDNILINSKGIHDYKFFNLSTFLEEITFKIEKEGLLYISNKYNISLSIAKEYCDYLKYDRLFYENYKLNFLLKLKDDLKDFIIYNNTFINSLKNKNITFYGYQESSDLKYTFKILDELNIKYDVLEMPMTLNLIHHEVNAFYNIEDESRFVFNSIKKMLNNGVNIKNIKIANYSEEYDFCFKRLSLFYKIPINFSANKNILSTDIAKFVLNNLDNYEDISLLVSDLKNKFKDSNYLKRIINIINSYKLYHYEPTMLHNVFEYEFEKMSYEKITYENGIELVDFNNYYPDSNDYIYLIGFNLGSVPKIFKNQSYLDDDILIKMGLDDAISINEQNRKKVLEKLHFNNLIISYKLTSPFSNYLPSTLVKELNFNVLTPPCEYHVNELEDRIVFSEYLDDYRKFGVINNNFLKNIYDINYLEYDNGYRKISKESLDKYLPDVMELSYSSLKYYFECPFKFYLNSILRVSPYEESIYAYMGNYAHYILEKSNDEDFSYEKVKEEAIKEVLGSNLKAKYLFFFNILDNVLRPLIEFNKNNEGLSSLSDYLLEKEIELHFDNNKLIFVGKVDKIFYTKEDDLIYYVVIDYKTGKDEASLDNITYGFNLQLPIYFYLIEKSKLFDNSKLLGLYLQKLNPDETDYRLRGYSKKGVEAYINKDYLHDLSFNKDGSISKNSLIFNEEEQAQMLELVEKEILDSYFKIRDGAYDIEPKKINNDDMSCKYCSFKSICYRKYSDYVSLEKEEFGGDEGGVEQGTERSDL